MDNSKNKSEIKQGRRDFIKKAAYTTPAIVTMAALPSFASAGSGWTNNKRRLYPNRVPGRSNTPPTGGGGL